MTQCIIVYLFPVALHKSRNEQQEGALRLVEVGDNLLHDLVFITRGDDDLCAGVQGFHAVAVQVIENFLQGFHGCQGRMRFVWHPLLDVQFFLITC